MRTTKEKAAQGLSRPEIVQLTNRYIGVSSDGFLGDFSYATHRDFYPLECGLDIDPSEYGTSTRRRFEKILETVGAPEQAKIIRGVLKRFPVGEGPASRTAAPEEQYQAIARRLEGAAPVATPEPRNTSAVVERAILDAETLIRENGPTSAIDRVHTALHGHLKALCEASDIDYGKDATLTQLFKTLRREHPKLVDLGPRPDDMTRLLNSMASVLDTLNPVRNNSSVAHPNDDLLAAPEAMLAINAARTLHHYLDSKLRSCDD